MAGLRSRLMARRPGWLVAPALTVAIALGLSAGPPRRPGEATEAWTMLVQAGDELAAGRSPAMWGRRPPLTAGKAYLLAFHAAQDAGDLEHVLTVADRLEAAGEPDLAAHVRRAADALLGELVR